MSLYLIMRNATAVEKEHSSMRPDPNELSTCTGKIYMTAQSNMLQQNIRKLIEDKTLPKVEMIKMN